MVSVVLWLSTWGVINNFFSPNNVTWYLILGPWYLICDAWHLIPDTFKLIHFICTSHVILITMSFYLFLITRLLLLTLVNWYLLLCTYNTLIVTRILLPDNCYLIPLKWCSLPDTCYVTFNDIDSLERIDANRSRKLGQNVANWGRKSLKCCKFRLEITKNRAEIMQIGPNFASMSA